MPSVFQKRKSRLGAVEAAQNKIDEFCKLLEVQASVKLKLEKLFCEFDSNHDGTIDIEEFRALLKEPLERSPLLRRVFASMDTNNCDHTHDSQSKPNVDMLDFLVGYYSLCTLQHGDYAIRFLWELYDVEHKGWISERSFRTLIRESMAACLPDYLVRYPWKPMSEEAKHKLTALRAGTEQWMNMRPGDLVTRIDQDKHKHAAVVRMATDESITVQDIYVVDNPLGWTQGRDHAFTYTTDVHDISSRVLFVEPGEPLFDDKLERFLAITADRNDDHAVTLKEFRRLIRRRVSKGEPSPYAATLELKRKARLVSGLGEPFWDRQSLELFVQMEKHHVWNAAELYKQQILKQHVQRPPRRFGGELLDPIHDREDIRKNGGHLLRTEKPRRARLEGEEFIAEFAAKASHAAETPGAFDVVDSAEIAAAHERALRLDRYAEQSSLQLTVISASDLVPADASMLGDLLSRLFDRARHHRRATTSDPYCVVSADDAIVGTTPVSRATLNPVWNHVLPLIRGVPKKLEMHLWDCDSKQKRDPLGFVVLLRAQIRRLCTTEARATVDLEVQGRTTDDRDATGTLKIALEWIAPDMPIGDSISVSERSEHCAAMKQDDVNAMEDGSSIAASDSLYVPPLPRIDESWICRSISSPCRCGRMLTAGPLECLLHIVSCPAVSDEPYSIVHIAHLSRMLDLDFEAKERVRLMQIQADTSIVSSPAPCTNVGVAELPQHMMTTRCKRLHTGRHQLRRTKGIPELPRAIQDSLALMKDNFFDLPSLTTAQVRGRDAGE